MDGVQFDNLVRRLSRGEIGRRQFVIGLLALAAGSNSVAQLARAQDPAPTPTSQERLAPTGDVETNQQFPCPEPEDPFGWICGNGPFGPWYPVIAPADITAASGIRWWGFQGSVEGSLSAMAFSRSGTELGHYRSSRIDGALEWNLGNGDTEMSGRLEAPVIDGDRAEIHGETDGIPFRVVFGEDGIVDPALELPAVPSAAQQQLVAQWMPALDRTGALFELSLATGQNPFAASEESCFVAGYLAVPALLGCALNPAGCVIGGGVGGYIIKECTDSW